MTIGHFEIFSISVSPESELGRDGRKAFGYMVVDMARRTRFESSKFEISEEVQRWVAIVDLEFGNYSEWNVAYRKILLLGLKISKRTGS